MVASDDAILELMFNPESREMPLDSIQRTVQTSQSKPIDPVLLEQLKALESKAKTLAEKEDLDAALAVMNECVALNEDYASAYNNRAQIHRLRKADDLALQDLDKAIELGEGQSMVLSQAYTQRAILKRQTGDPGAASDFRLGAQYGNPIARKINTEENPYAKLCNQTMLEVMSREIYGRGCDTTQEASSSHP